MQEEIMEKSQKTAVKSFAEKQGYILGKIVIIQLADKRKPSYIDEGL